MRYVNGEKIVVIEEKRTELDNGRVLIENLYEDGYVDKYTYIPYWHSIELKYYFRDYKAESPDSYIKLGRKIKSFVYVMRMIQNQDIQKYLMQYLSIPMNLRLLLPKVTDNPDKEH